MVVKDQNRLELVRDENKKSEHFFNLELVKIDRCFISLIKGLKILRMKKKKLIEGLLAPSKISVR